MSYFRQPQETKLITNNGGAVALGNQNVQFRINRQSRWLEKVILHANVTLGGTLSPVANQDYWENLFTEVRLRVSDKAGSNRLAIKAGSGTLINWAKNKTGRIDRFSKRIIRNAAAVTVGTYDLFIPVYLRHPSLNEPVGNRTCLPLFSKLSNGNGLDDDPVFEFDLAASGNALNLGASSTLTINRLTANLYYRDAGFDMAYIPQELVSQVPTIPGTTTSRYDIPKSGYLSSLLFEEFTDAALTTRGNFLPTATGADVFRLYYGRQIFKEFYSPLLIADNDQWAESFPFNGATNVSGQTPNISDLDLLHDTPTGDAVRGDSMLNLYSENQGDLAALEWTGAVSGTARFRVTTHKFLDLNAPALLLGA